MIENSDSVEKSVKSVKHVWVDGRRYNTSESINNIKCLW